MTASPRRMTKAPTVRCAIYTRKSTDDGLEQGFNSLEAQYEACTAYVASQRHEGWKLVPERFDDGGLSGGTLERPALQRLLAEVDAGRIGMIVVYKIDRLTRSLTDFAKLIDQLEKKGCSFVSVTQAFNTSSSMGRLTLNVLLSFAQFEREVTAERIRDKIAASKKKGLWMGGSLPLGYDPPKDALKARVLEENPEEAKTVKALFELYLASGSLTATRDAALQQGLSPRKADHVGGGQSAALPLKPFSQGQLHYLLTNPVYRGKIRHKTNVYPGQHEAIIDEALWEKVQARLQESAARKRRYKSRTTDDTPHPAEPINHDASTTEESAPLTSKIFDETGDILTPSHTKRRNRRFRYYISRRLITKGRDPSAWRLPAPQLEELVLRQVCHHLRVRAVRHDLLESPDATKALSLSEALETLAASSDPAALWPLVQKVTIAPGSLEIALDPEHLAARLAIDPDSLNDDLMAIKAPFTLKRRGVEAKLISGTTEPKADHILQKNLALAHAWVKAIRSGTSIAQIASSEQKSESAIRARLTLAFLAPQIQRAILDGQLSPEWTTDSILKRNLPADWSAQITALGL